MEERSVTCARCGAPAALSAASFEQRCPHCGAPLDLPTDVVAHVQASRALLDKLARDALTLDTVKDVLFGAERSRLVVVLVILLFSCGGLELFAATWAAIDKGADVWRERIVPPLVGLATAVAVAALALTLQSRAKRSIERSFSASAPTPAAPHGCCHLCGGPLAKATAAGGSVRCGYCGADNLVDKMVVVRASAAAAGALSAHAGELINATKRFSLITRGMGLALLVVLPLTVAVVHGVTVKLLGDDTPTKASPRRR